MDASLADPGAVRDDPERRAVQARPDVEFARFDLGEVRNMGNRLDFDLPEAAEVPAAAKDIAREKVGTTVPDGIPTRRASPRAVPGRRSARA